MAKGKSKLKIVRSYPPIFEADLLSLEARLSITLPQEYRHFLLLHNGGKPLQDCFHFKGETGPYTDSSVDSFLAVHDGEHDNFEKQYLFCKSEGLLANNLVPVADNPGGNRICLSISGSDANSVYFWDHEAIDEHDKNANLHLVADSFNEFLANLQEAPLYVAPEFDRVSLANDVEGLKALIASGWDVNTVHPGRQDTPIETSAIYARIEFVHILLEHGAKIGRALEIVERCLAMPHLADLRDYAGTRQILRTYMIAHDLPPIAERINTGTENPETSRALAVFNLTPQPQSGVAVFRASMSWPRDMPLPPVVVADSGGMPVPSALREMTQGADAKGRVDRVQLSFAIYFAADAVPANGWRTYVASYMDALPPKLENAPLNTDLVVVETTRHGGDLPMMGALEPGV